MSAVDRFKATVGDLAALPPEDLDEAFSAAFEAGRAVGTAQERLRRLAARRSLRTGEHGAMVAAMDQVDAALGALAQMTGEDDREAALQREADELAICLCGVGDAAYVCDRCKRLAGKESR